MDEERERELNGVLEFHSKLKWLSEGFQFIWNVIFLPLTFVDSLLHKIVYIVGNVSELRQISDRKS